MPDAKDKCALTVAVINHHLRGYPSDCLAALGAGEPTGDTEFILIQGTAARPAEDVEARFPNVRVIRLDAGDRAAAKDLALREAAGDMVLLITADTLPGPNALRATRTHLESRTDDVLLSAQLLQENGMRRRTAYAFPSIVREINPFTWVLRRYHRSWHKGRPPHSGTVADAPALHATCLAARRRVFAKIGNFTQGYRFAHEDIEYCARAEKLGIPRQVLLGAHVHKIPPQRYGELPVPVRAAMERSTYRLVRAMHSGAYAVAFCLVRRAKSLCKWAVAAVLNRIIFRCSVLLDIEEHVHRTILLMPWRPEGSRAIPPDVESHVRWEDVA